MKHPMTLAAILVLACTGAASAQEPDFDRFLRRFGYETRADMKIDSKRLVTLLAEKKAVLVDIRFPEETQAWKMGFGLQIPLNALPSRCRRAGRSCPGTRSWSSPVRTGTARRSPWPICAARATTRATSTTA